MDMSVRPDLASSPLYRWQFIWSLFVRSPRIRNWLFANQPIPSDHVYHSLRNGPALLGFDFRPVTTTATTHAKDYPYPNIGDLSTVYSFYDATLLGFNFGNCSLHPFLPPVYHMTKDPLLRNAKTIVRRTARRFINLSDAPCFLTIEFSWYETGSLSVFTWINPIPSTTDCHGYPSNAFTQHVPLFNYGELRFFNPSAAARFKDLANACNLMPSHQPYIDALIRAEEDHYVLRIQQPPIPLPMIEVYDIINNSNLPEPKISDFAHSEVVHSQRSRQASNTIPGSAVTTSIPDLYSSTEFLSPMLPKPDYERELEVAQREFKSMTVWGAYQRNIIGAREKGVFMSLVSYRTYWPVPYEKQIRGRYGSYQYMRTRISVAGRVQKLCEQLGLSLCSPKADVLLVRHTPKNPDTPENAIEYIENSAQISGDRRVDSTNYGASKACDVDRNETSLKNTIVTAQYDEERQPPCVISWPTEAIPVGIQEKERPQPIYPVSHDENVNRERGNIGIGNSAESVVGFSEETDKDRSNHIHRAESRSGGTTAEKEGPNECSNRYPKDSNETLRAHSDENANVYTNPKTNLYSSANENVCSNAIANLYSGGNVKGTLNENANENTYKNMNENINENTNDNSNRSRNDLWNGCSNVYLNKCPSECLSDSTDPSASSLEARQYESNNEERQNNTGAEPEDQAQQSSDNSNEHNRHKGLDNQLYGVKRKPEAQSIDKAEENVGRKSKWSTMVWTCNRCGAQIRGKRGNLNRHIASKHDNVRPYACEVKDCGRRFQTRLNMLRHVGAVHDGRPYACDKCSRTFKTEIDRHNHKYTAHVQVTRQLPCPICGGCFGRRSTLNRHLSNVHREGNLV